MVLAPSLHSLVQPIAIIVLEQDLPALEESVRDQAITFASRRMTTLPSHMRLGVALIAALIRFGGLLVGASGVRRLSNMHLPLIGEYFRLIRSLCYAFIWENWPDTRSDGAPT